MKVFITIISILVSTLVYSQAAITNDAVSLRIHNSSKHHLKELKVTNNDRQFLFNNINKRSYSETITIPYIWKTNEIELIVVVNQYQKNEETFLIKVSALNEIKNSKIESGSYTLKIGLKFKKNILTLDSKLIKS